MTILKPSQTIPLIENVPHVTILGDKFGESIDLIIRSKYGKYQTIKNINGYDPQEQVVKGSNHPYVIAVNEIIRPLGLWTLTENEARILQKAERENPRLGLRGKYVDIAKVLRNKNSYYNKNLPVTINLKDFGLQEKDNKLETYLRENSEIIQGDNADYKGTLDVQGVCLGGNRYLYSDRNDSDFSSSLGRVVIVSGEATQNFNDYLPQLKANYKESFAKKEEELQSERDLISKLDNL